MVKGSEEMIDWNLATDVIKIIWFIAMLFLFIRYELRKMKK